MVLVRCLTMLALNDRVDQSLIWKRDTDVNIVMQKYSSNFKVHLKTKPSL